MKTIRTKEKPREVIENFKPKKTKLRDNIVERQSKAKDYKRWLEATIRLFREEHKNCMNQKIFTPNDLISNLEYFRQKYLELNETSIYLKKVQGNSTFRVNYKKDYINIETYRNKSKSVTKIKVVEINWIEKKIRETLKDGKIEYLDSIDFSLIFAGVFDYDVKSKRDYYSNRFFQNFWTICLRLLREENVIDYAGGKIRLLEQKDSYDNEEMKK